MAALFLDRLDKITGCQRGGIAQFSAIKDIADRLRSKDFVNLGVKPLGLR